MTQQHTRNFKFRIVINNARDTGIDWGLGPGVTNEEIIEFKFDDEPTPLDIAIGLDRAMREVLERYITVDVEEA